MWPGRQKLELLRDAVRKACGSLLGSGFELQHSKGMSGLAVIRRLSFRDLLNEADQRKAILDFILESHRQITDCGVLRATYNSFVRITTTERPTQHS